MILSRASASLVVVTTIFIFISTKYRSMVVAAYGTLILHSKVEGERRVGNVTTSVSMPPTPFITTKCEENGHITIDRITQIASSRPSTSVSTSRRIFYIRTATLQAPSVSASPLAACSPYPSSCTPPSYALQSLQPSAWLWEICQRKPLNIG
jgi:hypothetical protein